MRLYDLTQDPPARRAELTLHDRRPGQHNDWVSDIAFTPDGRRVVGVMMDDDRDLGRGDRGRDGIRSSEASAASPTASPSRPTADGWPSRQPGGTGVTFLDISPSGP